ncbi:uncharacterized protein LOC122248163 isoform X2 [Penaeus japonicus]|uniref:uncharacterized protein LOC122248163 isoform X2 n=1 Tax=Penaeus japonicus TaxID=27405 RepID=UPI001C712590|nr:uncharacterized protein LOC122248163 isoform X2 [Penaeus japonicus]
MKVASCLCLLAVVVAVTAAPSDPASPTFHRQSTFNATVQGHQTNDKSSRDDHVITGSQHTTQGSEDTSVSSSFNLGSLVRRPGQTSDEHADDEHDTDSLDDQAANTTYHTPSHLTRPRPQIRFNRPTVISRPQHEAQSVEETTEHDEAIQESSESATRRSLLGQSSVRTA